MTDHYHISSLVVRVLPDRLHDVHAAIEALPGAEVHQSDGIAKLVAVLETADEQGIAAALNAIETLPGVLNAALIYHHVEETAGEHRESL